MNKTLFITSLDSPLHKKIITGEYDFIFFNEQLKTFLNMIMSMIFQ
jgi:hypothetical protein